MAWGPVAGVVTATSGAYSYHRDELCFRLLGQQLEWGSVDQPPATLLAAPLSDQIGWPTYVAQVAEVHRDLTADEMARAVIITGNYGEAGALDRFGEQYDLPEVFSGHNELWFRGHPSERADVVVAVGFPPSSLDTQFSFCEVAGTLDNGVDIPNEE